MISTERYNMISADSHVVERPDLFEKRLPAHLRGRAPKLVSYKGGSAWMVDGANPVPFPPSTATGSGYQRPNRPKLKAEVSFDDVLPALYDPVERIRAQNADSVDAEVLYPYSGLWDAVKELDDAELKVGCVQAYNDWIAEFCSHSPDRLIGLGKIPAGTEQARAELLRCVDDLRLRGIVLDVWPSGSGQAADWRDEAFWQTVNDLKVPVSVHYALGLDAQTIPPSGIGPGLMPPMAGTALPLVAAGLFDRYPNVRFVFAHGDAGWAMHWLEVMDNQYLRKRHLDTYKLRDPDALPSEYIRQHYWFTFHQDRSAVKMRHKLGPAHMVWASDFPLETSNWPDDRQQARRVTEELPAEEVQALLAGNTARLYQLPGYENGFSDTDLTCFEKLVYL